MKDCPVCAGLGRERRLALVPPDGRKPDLGECAACEGTGHLEDVLLADGRQGPRLIRVVFLDGSQLEFSTPKRKADLRIAVLQEGSSSPTFCGLVRVAADGALEYHELGKEL